ncbi:MAG TPA: sigma 54-interacting transcriptional regulator, partial [Myxococcaceae bacterium]|nr:sigma 54-interacting transcriptional regulator [Myxococcaceae bacterium]
MPGRLCLLVIGEQKFATYWLPEAGEVTVGRDAACTIRVEEPSVAPRHVALHIDSERVELEDLGSPQGTRLGETPAGVGRRWPLAPGEQFTLGKVLLVLQKHEAWQPPRRIWTHGYFESRLEEECIRAEREEGNFAVLRIRCDPQTPPAAIEETLSNVLRLVDVVGSYGPAEYEVILTDTPPAGAKLVADRLIDALNQRGLRGTVGVACYPENGRSPDMLDAQAGAEARGGGPPDAGSVSNVGAMQGVLQLVERIARGSISVVILGETGVGKERIAEHVHRHSPRATGPFLRLNCAALSETLLESELFGHEKGSFTGATHAKPGLLETAHGGTVFFDEVGELPMSVQVKLLRVIEDRQVTRVGGLRSQAIDVRFVSATNRDLESEVMRGRFRQDLYFRLNGISLVIPPLRERVSEIEGLAALFIAEASRRNGRVQSPSLSAPVLSLFKRYGWPGNVRELRNVIERAVLLCSDEVISLSHVPVERMSSTFAPRAVPPSPRGFGS